MQETVQALARAPGVALACVVDREGKVLSHYLPADIGNRFRGPCGWEPLDEALIQDQERWGTLIFSTSTATVRKSCLEQLLLQTGLGGLLWLCFSGGAWPGNGKRKRRRRADGI